MAYKLDIMKDGTKKTVSRQNVNDAKWLAVRMLSEGNTIKLRLPNYGTLLYIAPRSTHEENVQAVWNPVGAAYDAA
jgi:hypothetical protein